MYRRAQERPYYGIYQVVEDCESSSASHVGLVAASVMVLRRWPESRFRLEGLLFERGAFVFTASTCGPVT